MIGRLTARFQRWRENRRRMKENLRLRRELGSRMAAGGLTDADYLAAMDELIQEYYEIIKERP